MRRNKAAVLFSGGKDSTFACAKAAEQGYEIECLLTMVSENPESYMLHTPNIELTSLSAKAMGIPHFVAGTMGKKEEELLEIRDAVASARQEWDFDVLVTGALASVYQRDRIEKIARDCGLEPISPLWGTDQGNYLREVVSSGYLFIMTSVSAEGLDKSWLGREINDEEAEQLIFLSRKYGFNAAFEGGEAETLVLDCPLFAREKIKILRSKVDWTGFSGRLKIFEAVLEEKGVEGNSLKLGGSRR